MKLVTCKYTNFGGKRRYLPPNNVVVGRAGCFCRVLGGYHAARRRVCWQVCWQVGRQVGRRVCGIVTAGFFDCFDVLHNKRSRRPLPAKIDCAAPVCGRRNGPCLCLHRFFGARAYAAGVRSCGSSVVQSLPAVTLGSCHHLGRTALLPFGPLFSIRDGGAAIPLCRRDR